MVQNRCCLLKGGEVNLVWVFLVCCSCWLAPMMLMWVSSSSALLFCGVSLSSWRARCPNAPVMLLPNYFTLLILCSFFAVHCIRSLTRAIGTFWIVRCALLVGIVFWMLRPDGTVPRSRQHKLNQKKDGFCSKLVSMLDFLSAEIPWRLSLQNSCVILERHSCCLRFHILSDCSFVYPTVWNHFLMKVLLPDIFWQTVSLCDSS